MSPAVALLLQSLSGPGQLGAVLARDALPLDHGGGPDAGDVLRTPDGAVPVDAREPPHDHHERDGGAQLLVARGLRPHVRPGGHHVRCEEALRPNPFQVYETLYVQVALLTGVYRSRHCAHGALPILADFHLPKQNQTDREILQ